ncbi:MAG: hypothetical protein GWN64_17245 [Candidatus Thorarchaeota archaeon]|nr:hypothetical protein [Candidatus Thorarchaeota archaeon]
MSKINPEVVELEQWGRLLKHPDFKAFEKLLEAKLTSLKNEVESKYAKPSADRAYELIDLTARIDELRKLLSRVDFKKREYRQFEEESNNVRGK